MDPVSALGVAAAAAQFAGDALRVLDTLKHYLQAVKNAPKRSRELKAELLLVSDVLGDLKSNLETGSYGLPTANTSLTGLLDDFAGLIKEMAARTEVQKRDIKKRLQWPFTEKENAIYLSRLERFKNTFNLAWDALHTYLSFSRTLNNPVVRNSKTLGTTSNESRASLRIFTKWD